LYFLPDPQGQGSFLPGFGARLAPPAFWGAGAEDEAEKSCATLWADDDGLLKDGAGAFI
jgi:hypothetical protein